MLRSLFLAVFAGLFFSACESPSYVYRYVPGRTATLQGGYAVAPPAAPERVKLAIAAGNRIAGAPYRRGGGHAAGDDGSFDCSGATSYVLRAAGLMEDCMPSGAFRSYGAAGRGEWIDIYARNGHVFLAVAGLRFDTGWHGEEEGPRWTTRSRPASGAVIRHPSGL
ncbi:MAG: peptidoglycan endopeptidase [Chthoniobacteraceae bacterium]